MEVDTALVFAMGEKDCIYTEVWMPGTMLWLDIFYVDGKEKQTCLCMIQQSLESVPLRAVVILIN